MEDTLEVKEINVHHGRNVRRVRTAKGIKQEFVAIALNVSQQSVSRIEKQRVIKDELLARLAEILSVPVEIIANMEEDPMGTMVANNDIHENNNSTGYIGITVGETSIHHHNAANCDKIIDQIMALEKEKEKLYERLIETEKEKSQYLLELKEQYGRK